MSAEIDEILAEIEPDGEAWHLRRNWEHIERAVRVLDKRLDALGVWSKDDVALKHRIDEAELSIEGLRGWMNADDPEVLASLQRSWDREHVARVAAEKRVEELEAAWLAQGKLQNSVTAQRDALWDAMREVVADHPDLAHRLDASRICKDAQPYAPIGEKP